MKVHHGRVPDIPSQQTNLLTRHGVYFRTVPILRVAKQVVALDHCLDVKTASHLLDPSRRRQHSHSVGPGVVIFR